jgi:S1-C subfamily serine protease
LAKGSAAIHVYAAALGRAVTESFSLAAGEVKRIDRIVLKRAGAERSGLRAGDIVLAVQGSRVKSIAEARRFMTGPLSDDVLIEV